MGNPGPSWTREEQIPTITANKDYGIQKKSRQGHKSTPSSSLTKSKTSMRDCKSQPGWSQEKEEGGEVESESEGEDDDDVVLDNMMKADLDLESIFAFAHTRNTSAPNAMDELNDIENIKCINKQRIVEGIERLESIMRSKEDERRDLLGDRNLVSMSSAQGIQELTSFANNIEKLLRDKIAQAVWLGEEFLLEPEINPHPLFEIKESKGRGLGAFATQSIKAGTYVLCEAPTISIERFSDRADWSNFLTLEAELMIMPEEKRNKILSLHNNCNCGREPCKESPLEKIMNINAFGSDSFAESILHVTGSRFNHSCRPNLSWAHTKDLHFLIYARKPIQSGEELTISYIDPKKSKADRCDDLFEMWDFHCDCPSCLSDEDLTDLDWSAEFALSYTDVRSLEAKDYDIPILGQHSLLERAKRLAVKVWVWEVVPKLLLDLDGCECRNRNLVSDSGSNEVTFDEVWRVFGDIFVGILRENDMFGLGEEIIELIAWKIVRGYWRTIKAGCARVGVDSAVDGIAGRLWEDEGLNGGVPLQTDKNS